MPAANETKTSYSGRVLDAATEDPARWPEFHDEMVEAMARRERALGTALGDLAA